MTETISVLDRPDWDELIAGSSGEVFQTRRWLGVLAEVFGLKFNAVVETDGGRLVGGLPYCLIDDIRGKRITILPFSDFIYPVIADGEQWRRLVAPLMEYGVPISISSSPETAIASDDRFSAATDIVRHYVSLDGDLATVMSRYSSQPKRHIKRAKQAGLQFRLAETTAELRAFYELHFKVRKYRYGMLCQPYQLFETLWREFLEPGRGGLMLGFDGDTVVGGCLLLEHGDTLYYKYAASHPDYRAKGVSHGAVHGAIALGLERGLKRLDLGRSDTVQPGLVDFKRRFGAESMPLAAFKWLPPNHSQNEAGALFGELSGLLSGEQVPDETTERAGELMYRYFA